MLTECGRDRFITKEDAHTHIYTHVYDTHAHAHKHT